MTTQIQTPKLRAEVAAVVPPKGTGVEIVMRPTPVWKRVMDIVGSLCCGVISVPILVVIAVYIKVVSPGPAFFTQERLGHGGKPFRIWKLRTMHPTRFSESQHREYLRSLDPSKPVEKPTYQKRLIPGGEKIRKWSLDELPQLWNVLRGDMSLVGPRPDVLLLEDYHNDSDLRRFEVLPGITGLWQVSGKNDLSFDEMIELDVRYVDQMSIGQDAHILIRTLRILLRQDNS